MRIKIALLFLLILVSCENPTSDSTEPDDMAAELQRCTEHSTQLQENFEGLCVDAEELAAKITGSTTTVEDEAELCGVSVGIHKVDVDRGWVYLRYTIKDEQRFSDRLWFEGKSDRNVIRVSGTWEDVLLEVESCKKDSCEITCRYLVSEPVVCTNP